MTNQVFIRIDYQIFRLDVNVESDAEILSCNGRICHLRLAGLESNALSRYGNHSLSKLLDIEKRRTRRRDMREIPVALDEFYQFGAGFAYDAKPLLDILHILPRGSGTHLLQKRFA